jgi:hypothetical protein
MKDLRRDEDGLIPLILGIGIAAAALFGGSYLITGDDPLSWLVDLLKITLVASLLFIFGVLALMGRFVTIPRPWGVVVGLGAVAGSIYLVWGLM